MRLASIIIASRNEGFMLRQTVKFIRRAATRVPYEIILVDDGSTDDSFAWADASHDPQIRRARTEGLGIVPARNLGSGLAKGDMLVFCDAHIDVEPYWLDEFIRVMETYGTAAVTPAFCDLDHDNPRYSRIDCAAAARSAVRGWKMCGRTFRTLSAMTWMPQRDHPFETPILSGACFAVRADAFRAVGGYEPAFRGYGGEEEEVSLKLWLNGYSLYATPLTCVSHQFRRSAPYDMQITDILHNRLYTALCHYKDARVRRLVEEQARFKHIQAVYRQVFTKENTEGVRRERFLRRVRDDDWFFAHFGLDL